MVSLNPNMQGWLTGYANYVFRIWIWGFFLTRLGSPQQLEHNWTWNAIELSKNKFKWIVIQMIVHRTMGMGVCTEGCWFFSPALSVEILVFRKRAWMIENVNCLDSERISSFCQPSSHKDFQLLSILQSAEQQRVFPRAPSHVDHPDVYFILISDMETWSLGRLLRLPFE